MSASGTRGLALNFVTFNQDNSVLGVATSKGFQLYTTEPFQKYYQNEAGDVSVMEMLFSTSLVALILSPRVLRILNTKRDTTICDLTFPMKILAVRMNRKRLVVVLEESIYNYDISNMKLLHTIETSPNPLALCALSSHSESNYMAYPQPAKPAPTPFSQPAHAPPQSSNLPPATGEVIIFDANKTEAVNVIDAHQSTLGSLSINNAGDLLATASEKGTIIRIFSVPNGDRLFHFRRGSLPAQIYSMAFNATSSLLAVSSATETIHIFRLVAQQPGSLNHTHSHQIPAPGPAAHTRPRRTESLGSTRDLSHSPSSEGATTPPITIEFPSRFHQSAQTWGGLLRQTSQNFGLSIAQTVGSYLPASVTEMWEPARDFAWVKIPRIRSQLGGDGGAGGANGASAPVRSVVAMSSAHPKLLVVTSEGQCLVYHLDLERGGEGILEKQHS